MHPRHAQRIARRIMERLQQGTAPWLAPWASGRVPPYNPITGLAYRSINSLWLDAQDYRDPRWLTAAQARALGASIRPGEQGTKLIYWKHRDTQVVPGNNGQMRRIDSVLANPRAYLFTVFNAEQLAGLPPLAITTPTLEQRLARAETILTHSGAKLIHIPGSHAHYSPDQDQIVLPPREGCADASTYYASALHALTHWTGHPTRLNRALQHPAGSERHAREALRTDIAAWMLSQRLGISAPEAASLLKRNSKANAWIKLIEKDPRELFRAASKADTIADTITGFERGRTREHTREQVQAHAPHHQRSTDTHLTEQISIAKRQAQQHAEDLLTLAHVREQQAHHNAASNANAPSLARERRTAAEVVTLASDRLTEIRAEARDALTFDRHRPRPVVIAVAATTQTNEHLRERVKRERQDVHHDVPGADRKATHERTWWELTGPERQRIIEAVKAGQSVTLPRDAPSELRSTLPEPAPLPRPSRSRDYEREQDTDF